MRNFKPLVIREDRFSEDSAYFLSGFLYEEFDSYILPFCFSGTMYFLSGALCVVVYCLSSGKANLISEGPENYDSTMTDEGPLCDIDQTLERPSE